MTNQILESAGAVSGQGVPTPVPGVATGQPPSSGQVTFTLEQHAEIKKIVEQERQGWKDQRLQRFEDELTSLKAAVQPQQATQVPQAQAPSLANGVTQPAQPSVDVEKLFSHAGIEKTDNEAWLLAGKYQGNAPQLAYELLQLKERRASIPAPSLAAVSPSPSGGVGSPENIDAQAARLETLLRNPGQNKAEIARLTQEIDASGALR